MAINRAELAQSKAELAYSQGLWYAWGRMDSGQYRDKNKLEVFEFAKRVAQSKLAFELEKTYLDESIQGQWDKYVAEKYPEVTD